MDNEEIVFEEVEKEYTITPGKRGDGGVGIGTSSSGSSSSRGGRSSRRSGDINSGDASSPAKSLAFLEKRGRKIKNLDDRYILKLLVLFMYWNEIISSFHELTFILHAH